MRFRFTIRDLLWLTALVAVSVCWAMTLAENRRLKAAMTPTYIPPGMTGGKLMTGRND